MPAQSLPQVKAGACFGHRDGGEPVRMGQTFGGLVSHVLVHDHRSTATGVNLAASFIRYNLSVHGETDV
jgi:hypothetical protein